MDRRTRTSSSTVTPRARDLPHGEVIADKYAHLRLARSQYSVPIACARRSLIAKLHHDRVTVARDDLLIANKVCTYDEGVMVLGALDVLPLLEEKHRAVSESTTIQQWDPPPVLHELRARLRERSREGDQEWVRVMLLSKRYGLEDLTRAVEQSLKRRAASLDTIEMILEQGAAVPIDVTRPSIACGELLSERLIGRSTTSRTARRQSRRKPLPGL